MKRLKICNYVILSMFVALSYVKAETDIKDHSPSVQREAPTPNRLKIKSAEKANFNKSQERYFSIPTIKSLQIELKNQGYIEKISGNIDSQTREALKNYQKDKKLEVTGEFDKATMNSLELNKAESKMQEYSE